MRHWHFRCGPFFWFSCNYKVPTMIINRASTGGNTLWNRRRRAGYIDMTAVLQMRCRSTNYKFRVQSPGKVGLLGRQHWICKWPECTPLQCGGSRSTVTRGTLLETWRAPRKDNFGGINPLIVLVSFIPSSQRKQDDHQSMCFFEAVAVILPSIAKIPLSVSEVRGARLNMLSQSSVTERPTNYLHRDTWKPAKFETTPNILTWLQTKIVATKQQYV